MFKKGEILKKRKELKLSQTKLAQYIGISRPTLHKIETAERKATKEEAEKITTLFQELLATEINETTNLRINIPEKNIEKFKSVMLYVLEKVGAKPNVGLTVLYKLLYFIDFDYYEKFEKQLMGLTYFKNTHGPTPREFKKIVDQMKLSGQIEEMRSSYFKLEQRKFLPRIEADLSLLNGQEMDMIESVLSRYSDKSARELSDMTHRDMPWKASEDGQDIDYELVFYRPDEFSVREYDEL